MSRRFKSFEELKHADELLEILEPKPESDLPIEVAANINYTSNRVFMWLFSEKDVEDFIDIFALLRQPKIGMNRSEFRARLVNKCNEMLKRGICPVEPLLYASKTVNKVILNDMEDQEVISDVIVEIAKDNRKEVIDTLKHILEKWNWTPQLKIAILAAGKLKDADLVLEVYSKFSTKTHINFNFELMKMLIYSSNKDFVNQITSILSRLDGDNNKDRAIGNFFKEKFDRYMGKAGIDELYRYYSINNEYIGDFGRKMIRRLLRECLGEEKISSVAQGNGANRFTYLKNLCTEYKNCDFPQRRQELKQEILDNLYSRSPILFQSAVYCLRFTKDRDFIPELVSALNRKGIRYNEYKNAIITMGFLKNEDDSIVEQISKRNPRLKYAKYAYYIIKGSEAYKISLVEELLRCQDASELYDIEGILKDVIESHGMKDIIRAKLKTLLLNYNKSDVKTALTNTRKYWKQIVDTGILDLLYEGMGYPDKPIVFDREEQEIVLNLTREVINEQGRIACKYLEYVKDRADFSTNIRNKANKILLNDFEPTAPA